MQFNLTGHRKLWNWLAAHPEKDKDKWPGWDANGGEYKIPINECFACEYDNEFDSDCTHCPLAFNDCCFGYGELFDRWFRARQEKDMELTRTYALAIVNTPVRKGVKTI